MINSKTRVCVVDDNLSARRALCRLLEMSGYSVDGFSSAEEFLKAKLTASTECLLLDVRLPGMNGVALHELLQAQHIFLPTIFITGHGDIPMAVHAVKSGAAGFLTKPFIGAELIAEIEGALQRFRLATQEYCQAAQVHHRFETLTSREKEILALVVKGKLNKQTAAELGIVENTVKVHRRRVMTKMQAESVPDLVLMAQKLNLINSHDRLRNSV